jgi:hypothetical protein
MGGLSRSPPEGRKPMNPYRVHLDDWTVAMYASDDGRLTFTVANSKEPEDYLTKVVGEVRLRRYYIGRMCAGDLKPSPFPTYRDGTVLPTDGAKITPAMLDSKADLEALIDDSKQWTKEAILAQEGAG